MTIDVIDSFGVKIGTAKVEFVQAEGHSIEAEAAEVLPWPTMKLVMPTRHPAMPWYLEVQRDG